MRRPTPSRLTARRSLLRDESGTALVEFALVGSLLLMLVLGVIEYGNVFSGTHTLTSLSREGANLAARGSTLQQAVDNVLANGADMNLAARGGVIATRIVMEDGSAEIEEQVASSGYQGRSLLGVVGGPAQNVDPWQLQEDQRVYVVEIFYTYDALTPFEGAFSIGIPDELYERAIF